MQDDPYSDPTERRVMPFTGHDASERTVHMRRGHGDQENEDIVPVPYSQDGDYPPYPAYPTFGNNYVDTAVTMAGHYGVMEPHDAEPTARLARPFPLWLTALIAVVACTLVALTYSVAVGIAGADWADGARAAGVMAFLLGALTVAGLFARLSAHMQRTSTVLLAIVLTVVLVLAGTAGVFLGTPLHTAQAHALEQHGAWAAAIHEYAAGGETAPRAPDIARAYVRWGEQLATQKRYAEAVTRFATVTSQYAASGDMVQRADDDAFQAYSTWIRSNAADIPYVDAIAFLVTYQTRPGCTTACAATVGGLIAQARYQHGVQLVARNNLTEAVLQFEFVQARFAASPYAAKAHTAAATAYLALGKQELSANCTGATPTYQTLADKYADTPEGQQAKAALGAPQPVTGGFSDYPTNPAPTIFLSKSVDPNTSNFSASRDYRASSFDTKTGIYKFDAVAPGTYYLTTFRDIGSYLCYTLLVDTSSGGAYAVQVSPLCPVTLSTSKFQDKQAAPC